MVIDKIMPVVYSHYQWLQCSVTSIQLVYPAWQELIYCNQDWYSVDAAIWSTVKILKYFDTSWWMCLVAQSCPTLCDLMDCSPPGSSDHGDSPGKILEWVAMPSSRGSPQPRHWTQVCCAAGRFFTDWASSGASAAWRAWSSPQQLPPLPFLTSQQLRYECWE